MIRSKKMKRFLGCLFAFFAVISFFGGFVDPELGIGGGIFGAVFWGVIANFLLKKKKLNGQITTISNPKNTKRQVYECDRDVWAQKLPS